MLKSNSKVRKSERFTPVVSSKWRQFLSPSIIHNVSIAAIMDTQRNMAAAIDSASDTDEGDSETQLHIEIEHTNYVCTGFMVTDGIM